MVSFTDSPLKFSLLPPSPFLQCRSLSFGLRHHEVIASSASKTASVVAGQRALLVFPARNRAFETSLWDNLRMRALLSQQGEPSLKQSTGNYFSHVLRSNLPTAEKCPKVHFALFLKTRISTNEAHVSSSFTTSFHSFWLRFGKNVAR